MKTKNLLPLWCLLPFLLAGCSSLYFPNLLPTPNLQKAGDLNLTATAGTGESFLLMPMGSTLDLQGAYAVTDHVGVLANYATYIDLAEPENRTKHNFLEGGIGWFGPLGKSAEIKEGMYGFAFTGVGAGKAKDPEELDLLYKGKYRRFFVQPGFGYRSPLFEAGAAGRLAFVHFSEYEEYHNGSLKESSSFKFSTFEPVGYLGFGSEKIKFYAQIGLTLPLEKEINYEDTEFSKVVDISSFVHYQLGVTFKLTRKNSAEKLPGGEGEAPLLLNEGKD